VGYDGKCESCIVESVQAINGSEPQKTILVLQAAVYTVVRETVFYMIVFEIVFLGTGSCKHTGKAK